MSRSLPEVQGAQVRRAVTGMHAYLRRARTRAEFQRWALEVAQAHGYDVEFAGIGRAEEPAALASAPGADVGCASQVRWH